MLLTISQEDQVMSGFFITKYNQKPSSGGRFTGHESSCEDRQLRVFLFRRNDHEQMVKCLPG